MAAKGGSARGNIERNKRQSEENGEEKTQDHLGVVVEMLQHGGGNLFDAIAKLFTDILDPKSMPPKNWKLDYLYYIKIATYTIQGIIDRLQCCRSCTNYSAKLYVIAYGGSLMQRSQLSRRGLDVDLASTIIC